MRQGKSSISHFLRSKRAIQGLKPPTFWVLADRSSIIRYWEDPYGYPPPIDEAYVQALYGFLALWGETLRPEYLITA